MSESSDADQRFPKTARLRKRREFLRTQNTGQRSWGRRFLFQFKTSQTSRNRLGITASKKVGNAVVRNRIKRWVREVFRQHPELHQPRADGRHIDIVVTAKRGVSDFTYANVRDEMLNVITRYLQDPASAASSRRRRGGASR